MIVQYFSRYIIFFFQCDCNGSGKLPWEQVLRHAKLRKRYIALYASLLKSEPGRVVVDGNDEIDEMDRELDIDLILQWR